MHVPKELLEISKRYYWSRLFHCYNIRGLPRTKNDHKNLYAQIKRRLRRQRGVQDLHDALRRHGAWLVFLEHGTSPEESRERLAQVSWETHSAERARYEQRQALLRRRYQWRHQQEAVRRQRLDDWTEAVLGC